MDKVLPCANKFEERERKIKLDSLVTNEALAITTFSETHTIFYKTFSNTSHMQSICGKCSGNIYELLLSSIPHNTVMITL